MCDAVVTYVYRYGAVVFCTYTSILVVLFVFFSALSQCYISVTLQLPPVPPLPPSPLPQLYHYRHHTCITTTVTTPLPIPPAPSPHPYHYNINTTVTIPLHQYHHCHHNTLFINTTTPYLSTSTTIIPSPHHHYHYQSPSYHYYYKPLITITAMNPTTAKILQFYSYSLPLSVLFLSGVASWWLGKKIYLLSHHFYYLGGTRTSTNKKAK